MIPPTRILVAVDFSESSRVALAFAARLALRGHSELDVLHVIDPWLSSAARATGINLPAQAAEELQRFLRDTAPADAASPRTHVSCGQAAQVICDIGAREEADVVVVGAHGMSAAKRWVFGSTTDRVLRQARTSVFVIPSDWRPLHPQTDDLCGLGPVIAAVDFSESGVGAAWAAARFARFLNTTLTVLHVVPEIRVIERWSTCAGRAMAESERNARVELETALSRLSAVAPIDLRVVTGDIVGSILHAAQPTGACAPLLVLGRRPHEADTGGRGTVVSRALASLRVPMLVVDPAEGTCEV